MTAALHTSSVRVRDALTPLVEDVKDQAKALGTYYKAPVGVVITLLLPGAARPCSAPWQCTAGETNVALP